MGERRRRRRGGRQVRHSGFPTRRSPPSSPAPYPATTWRRGCQAAVAHRTVRSVNTPSCVGKPPVRLLLGRLLREGRPWGHQIRGGRQIRVCPAPATPPPYALHPLPAPLSHDPCTPLVGAWYTVGGVQRSAQGGAVVGAVADRRLAAAEGVGPRRAGEHEDEYGAKHVTPAMETGSEP